MHEPRGIPLLTVSRLQAWYGESHVLHGVEFQVNRGEVVTLLGRNGAGKTTFVSLLSGRRRPQSGRVLMDGTDITALPAHARVRKGIAYTFQITSIFPRLSVFDNVALAAQTKGAQDLTARVRAALARVGLAGLEAQEAQTLSYGHQRLLELGMGLALGPRLLILDEPTQGLAASEIQGFMDLVRSLVPDTTVLLIEHNMKVVMDLATRITVLTFGRVLATGTPDQIRANAAVQEAYLGA